jgi:oligopeptide transport system substrate-binding protein
VNPIKIYNRLKVPLLVLLLCSLLPFSSCTPFENNPQSLSIPQKDTLVLFDAGPLTLDPAIIQDVGSYTYVMHIFSGLVAFDQDMNLVPDIAESWEISSDGRTYTFYLRQGVKFHNGKEVTASDFKYSWERACRPQTESPTAATYLNDVIGAKEMLSGEAEEIEGIEVVDEHTLRVGIDNPKAYFLAKLTYPVAFVVDEANVESGEEWWRKPVGTGPFELKGWEENELLLLERNELYYRDKAKVSYIAFRLYGAPMQMYETGEIDVTDVYLQDLERAMDETNPLHQELQIFHELSLSYIVFNTSEPPFDDPQIRQAFCYAVDKDRVISQVLQDSVSQADSIVPPGMPDYDGGVQGLSYDLDKAKELIAGATLPPLTFTTLGEGGYVSTSLTAILYQWQQNLGVEIEVRQLESEAYFYRLDEEKDEMFDYGWVADYPDPQNFLEALFGSESENNKGEYSNSEVDDLLAQAAIEQDSETRFELYREAEQMIIDDAPCLPLWFGQNYVLVKPYVKGYVVSPLGIPLLSNVYLESP